MANEYIGRRVEVGLGIETTAGTAVAPQIWVPHLGAGFQRRNKQVQNESAMGRVEKVNDSAVTAKWADGSLNGKVGDKSIGYLLYSVFGSPTTTDNADSDAAVKDHTFNVSQTNSTPTLTVVRKDAGVSNRRHALGTVGELNITSDDDGWIRFESDLKAKAGANGSDTPAYTAENEFLLRHTTIKLASNVAGLGAASALDVRSFKLEINRNLADPFIPAGSVEPTAFDATEWEASGEIVLRYNATTFEDLWYDNTKRALQIALINNDVTIGSAARPSLTFTAPQASLTSFEKSDDLDEIVEQTIEFSCELSLSDAYALRAVLTNTQAAYAAA